MPPLNNLGPVQPPAGPKPLDLGWLGDQLADWSRRLNALTAVANAIADEEDSVTCRGLAHLLKDAAGALADLGQEVDSLFPDRPRPLDEAKAAAIAAALQAGAPGRRHSCRGGAYEPCPRSPSGRVRS
jgi:hypothetical protein